eukprot:11111283-Alexandrium_andersonii.AAC.1
MPTKAGLEGVQRRGIANLQAPNPQSANQQSARSFVVGVPEARLLGHQKRAKGGNEERAPPATPGAHRLPRAWSKQEAHSAWAEGARSLPTAASEHLLHALSLHLGRWPELRQERSWMSARPPSRRA